MNALRHLHKFSFSGKLQMLYLGCIRQKRHTQNVTRLLMLESLTSVANTFRSAFFIWRVITVIPRKCSLLGRPMTENDVSRDLQMIFGYS